MGEWVCERVDGCVSGWVEGVCVWGAYVEGLGG